MDRGEYEVNTSHSSCLPLSGSVPVRYFQGNLHFAFFFRHSFRVWGVKQKLNNQSKKKKKSKTERIVQIIVLVQDVSLRQQLHNLSFGLFTPEV